MSYFGTPLNGDLICDDNEFLRYLENCHYIGIQGDCYTIEYDPHERYYRSKTSRVSPQEFFQRLDRLLTRNLLPFPACIRLFNKICALRKKNAHLPAVQADVDRLLRALLASQIVQAVNPVDFMSSLGTSVYIATSVYKGFIDAVKETLLSEAASRDEEEAASPLQLFLSRFIPLLDPGTKLRLALFAGDYSEISRLYENKEYKALINLLIELKHHPRMRQLVLALILKRDQKFMIPPNLWAEYLYLGNGVPADLTDSAYIDSLQQIFRHYPGLAQHLFLSRCGSVLGIQALLAVSQSYPELDMKEPMRYLFAQYSNRPEVLPWIIDYFLYKKQYPKARILLTLEEEEQFISNYLFSLLEAYRWDESNSAFNKLLIEELKIKLIDKNFSDCPMAFIFGFVKQHSIADTQIINVLAEWAMKTDALSEQDILELAGLAVLSGDLVLMRKIINHYHKNPHDETAQGRKWQDFIKAILKEGHYKSKPVAEPMIGLLYGHQQGFLSDSLEFDFLISHCCHDYHRIWLVSNQQDMTADSDLRVHESSMMDQYQAAPVYEAAKSAFPALNVKASYTELIQYIEKNLCSLEEKEGKAGNKQFIPEYRYKKEGTVSGKIEETTGEECLEEMTERQMAIARCYTALRLLKRAEKAENSFDPYFNDPGMDFTSMVAYCYEMAKKSGCLELLVVQLADIRRIHSMDTKAGALSAKDQPSCPAGSRGRLCRTYVMSHNRQLELAREKLGLEIKKFNSESINAVIERFVQNTLIAFKIDILKNGELSAIPEEYRHLAAIFACYQKLIAGELLSDEEKLQAEQAIATIVDKKIDYLALYQNLAQLHTTDKISVCPEEVQFALRAYIECQLKALFLWDEDCKNRLGAARLDSVQEGDLCWKDFPEMVVANTYPEVLTHFLLADTINFNALAEYASYLATPKFRDNIQRILYQLVARLSDQRVLTAEDEKTATDAHDLFFKQMHTLAASGIIPKEDLSAIFTRVLLVALHNKAFFLEIVSFIKGDADLLETDLRDIFAKVIISALEYKVPNEKMIDFMGKVNEEFHIDVKVQCADLLEKVPYTHYAQFNRLLSCLEGMLPVKEIIQAKAKKLIDSNDYTAYLRLIRFSLSALNMRIDLYDRDTNKALIRKKQEAVASFLGSFSSINPARIENFQNLKAASVKGDAYASFALMELYFKGHAISEDGQSRIEDQSLAFIYAAIAKEQAKALGNPDLIKEIQISLGATVAIPRLEEVYYSYLLRLLNTKLDSKEYQVTREIFLLIISSLNLEMIFDNKYESSNKSAVQKIITQCCSTNNLDKAENLLHICALMEEKGAYIQSSGGNARAADPRNLSRNTRDNLHYQWLLAELKKIALLKPSSITAQDVYLRLRQAAGAKGSEVADKLKHVYKHLFEDFSYDKNIHHDDEKLTQLLRKICANAQVSLNIRAPNSPFITGGDKPAAKGKDQEKTKEKEAVNGVFARLQRYHAELSAQLKHYPDTRSALSEMDGILTQMIESDECTELQRGTLCSLLKIIKLTVADDSDVAGEIKAAVNDCSLQMLNLFDDRVAMEEDDENSATLSWREAAVDTSGSSLSADSAVSVSSDVIPSLSSVASSESSSSSSSSSSSAGFFVQRNLKGQPYTRSMRSSRRSDVSDSHANPLSTLSGSMRSSDRSEASDSLTNPFGTFSSSHSGSSGSMRSSRRSDVYDSRQDLAHNVSSSSSSSNPPRDSAANTMGSRLIDTIFSVGSRVLGNQGGCGGGGVTIIEPPIVLTNIDEVLSDLVDPHRDDGAAIARPLTGIVPAQRPKKISLIGECGVGKSCLLLRLVHGTYTESYISTIGVDWKAHRAAVGGQTFQSKIWDLCAQDRFRINTASYHEAASIVLCFDVSDYTSFAALKRWCIEVERYAPSNVKVILIGTKCDLVAERQVPYAMARDFADTLGIYYLETSARNSINIERLGALIELAPYSQREQHLERARDYDMGVARQNRFGL